MSRLERLQPQAVVRGILPDALVTVVNTQWFGSEALELTYKTPDDKVANQLLYRHDKPRLEVVEQDRPWKRQSDPCPGRSNPAHPAPGRGVTIGGNLRSKPATVAELSEAFRLSPRKVYRIIDDLPGAGYPVRVEETAKPAGRGRPGKRYGLSARRGIATREFPLAAGLPVGLNAPAGPLAILQSAALSFPTGGAHV